MAHPFTCLCGHINVLLVKEEVSYGVRCAKTDTLPTSLFCWVCCHLHLLFRASLSAPLFIMVYRDFLSIRSLSWKPHIPDRHRCTTPLLRVKIEDMQQQTQPWHKCYYNKRLNLSAAPIKSFLDDVSFLTSCLNVSFHRSSKGFSCLTVSVDCITSGASNPDGSSAAPAVLTLGSQQSPSAGT